MEEWVTEQGSTFGMTIRCTEHLHHEKTPFQTIDVYQTAGLGRMLLLDGIIQLTEADEFAYQEMMTHVPLFSHPCPENVLVIGGGDGGVLREIARHSCVRRIDHCEIDERVIAVSKEYLPFMATGFQDPRVHVYVADGSEFIRDKRGCYDVIIVDSTDPGGPGAPLFTAEFYRNMRSALRSGGIIATQAESPYLLPDVVKRLYDATRSIFPAARYGMMMVPSYPTGTIGVCTGALEGDPAIPVRTDEAVLRALKYYTPEIHRAAFRLPAFVETLLA